MAKKKTDPSPVRLAVNNAEPAAPAPSDDGGDSGTPRRTPPGDLPPDCPVVPLGMGAGVRYYLNGARQLVALKIREHVRLEILGLFGEDADMVRDIWPAKKQITKEDGAEEWIVTGWKPADAEVHLLRLTAAKGIWSPTEKARGRGCWRGDAGELVVNAGAMVHVNGAWRRPGVLGDYVMTAGAPIMKPALLNEPGGAGGAGAEMLKLLATWHWKRPEIDPRLKLGLIGCRFLGPALRVRPVEWDIGPKNTGKSTLQTAEADMMGGWVVNVLDPTPAAIWQTLRQDGLAVAIDEAESDEDRDNRRRLNELIKLARMAYSGGKLPRGSSDGEATEYVLRSGMLFSSINLPPLLPQDRSRMIVLRLGLFPIDQPMPDLSRERLRKLGARLLRRVIDGFPRLAPAIEQYRIALKAVGHEGRSSEVYATALGVADIILSDEAVDSDSAAAIAEMIPYASLLEAQDDLLDEESWLVRLLSCRLPLDGTGERNTIAALLREDIEPRQRYLSFDKEEADNFRKADQVSAARLLSQYGIKVMRSKQGGAPMEFAVADRGQGIAKLHEGTRWAGRDDGAIGGWRAAARELPGSRETKQRFGDLNVYGTAIPLRLAFPPDDGGADDVPTPNAAAEPAGAER